MICLLNQGLMLIIGLFFMQQGKADIEVNGMSEAEPNLELQPFRG
jgi:hypothetical protein